MINGISIGQYYPTESFVHKMDPKAKLTVLFMYILSLFIVSDYVGYGLLAALGLFFIWLSKVPIINIIKSLKVIFIFIIFAAMMNIFLTAGDVIWQWGVLKVTKEGLIYASYMAIRLIMLIAVSTLITYTTTPIALTDAIEEMLKPLTRFKFPAHEMAMMMSIALRFIPTLMEETDKIIKAQMSRGVAFTRGKLRKLVSSMLPLLIPLFVGAFRRAEDLANAMEARGYHGGVGRTKMKVQVMVKSDYLSMIFMGVIFIFSITYRWFL